MEEFPCTSQPQHCWFLFHDGPRIVVETELEPYIGLVHEFRRAMCTDGRGQGIPVPAEYTRVSFAAVVDFLRFLHAQGILNPLVTKEELAIPVVDAWFAHRFPACSDALAALHASQFAMCNIFSSACSVYQAHKWLMTELPALAQTCGAKSVVQILEPFRFSRCSWMIFPDALEQVFGKEPDWDTVDPSLIKP